MSTSKRSGHVFELGLNLPWRGWILHRIEEHIDSPI
jgi:hypothetical protein